ncbi:cadherin-like domain-containing protein [Variovorax sp. dw_308]|uniref:cadherin-like domain-containing protein n=1 Tax=Variovorax sp. dw_308 TaxID=2721546 RepID=UPI001C442A6D|nr:Ig-like domain-containing protein [Variovorax sp. dw_308]
MALTAASAAPKKIRLQALEARVLLDAAAAATAETTAEQAHAAAAPAAPDAGNAELMHALEQANSKAVAPVEAEGTRAPQQAAATGTNVYFIDRSVEDSQVLVASLGANAEVHFIESNTDGVHAIAETLQGRTDIAAIHIISHGAEGHLELGNAILSTESMQGQYRDDLTIIGHALAVNGDILIYGCDFGAGTEGAHAAEVLSDIAGADVAASTDPTGAERLGGNWTLEDHVGSIEATSVEARDWDHTLAPQAPVVVPASSTSTTLDTDGDGVIDNTDIDDDNDGILDVIEDWTPSLVDGTNEGAFGVAWTENTNTASLNSTVAGTGWTSNEGTADTWKGPFSLNGSGFWAGAMNGVPGAADGDVFIAFYNGSLTESIARTIPASAGIQVGDTVRIDFAQIFGGVNGMTTLGTVANLIFTIDGVAYSGKSLTYEGNVAKTWSTDSFTFIAKSTAPKIVVSIGGAGEARYLGFDSFEIRNVSALARTGGKDSDNDGIPDRLDIDSDNDGITDNVEAQASGSYIAPSGSGLAMTDLDHDGLDDRYDANTSDISTAASKGLTPVDTDGDGKRDYLDLDSDNDGKLDVVERGDGAPTSLTSTVDSDRDGLLDIFEGSNPNNGFVVNGNNLAGGKFTLADSDGDTASSGIGAVAMTRDFDYRDATNAPLIDLNSAATGADTARDNAVAQAGGAPGVAIASATADVNDLGDNDLSTMRIAVGGVRDGASEIVNIGGTDFVLNANSTKTVSIGGNSFSVAYTTAGGFVITRSAGGVMPEGSLDALVRGITYRDTKLAATAGNRTLSFALTDAGGTVSPTAVATISVVPGNTPPLAGADLLSTNEDTPLALNLLANDTDADGDTLRIDSINGVLLTPGTAQDIAVPHGMVKVAADGSMSFVPAADYNGPVAFNYVVRDPSGAAATGNVTVDVKSVNDAPVGRNDVGTAAEDTTLNVPKASGLLANDTDVDGDTLSVTGFSIPGVTDANYTITDGKGGDSTGELTLKVTAVNDAPVAGDDTLTVKEDTPLVLDLLANDTDVDGDTLKITSINGTPLTGGAQTIDVPNGKVNVAIDGTISFTPNRDYNGPVSFTYEASDPSGAKGTGTVNIAVTPVNDAPVIQGPSGKPANPGNLGEGNPGNPGQPKPGASDDGTAIVTEDTPLVVTPENGLLRNVTDPDGDTLAIKDFTVDGVPGPILAGQPANIPGVGVLVIHPDGGYTFTPAPNYNGPVPGVHYTVDDGHGGEATGELILTVKPVNDAPVANDDAVTTLEDTPVVLDLLGNDTDADGDALKITSINGTPLTGGAQDIAVPNGMVHIGNDGTITFVPAPDYNGPVGFNYEVSDASGGKNTGHVSITVTSVNDAPVVIGEKMTGTNDHPIVAGPKDGLLANDRDVDGDALTIKEFTVPGVPGPIEAGKPVEIPGVGTLNINADGSYSFTPNRNYSGDLSVVYTVSDGKGGLVNATLTLHVLQADDMARHDYPFVYEPSDDLFGRHTGEWRNADGTFESLTGAPRLDVEGAVVDAVNGVQSLNGTQELNARGVVLQAVNGVDSLHGSSVESTQRVLGAVEGSNVVSHVASDNTLHTQLNAVDGFSVEPRSITSLRLDGDVHLELVSHGQQTWIDVSDLAAPGHSAIQSVSATLADGKALPSWIRVDGHGHIAIDRPVGAEVLTLRIKVARASGQSQTHVIEIDSNAVEMRKVGESTKDKSGKSGKAAGKTASMTFADQLGHASKAPASVDAELMALLG